MNSKIVNSLDAAIADLPDGARIMFGGFGGRRFSEQSDSGVVAQGHEGYHRDQQ